MRLFRVALMILAVLSSTMVTAAAHHRHGETQVAAAASLDNAPTHLGRDDADRADDSSSRTPSSHHHDTGKCCGLPCCSTFFGCSVTASLTVPLFLVRAPTLVVDDRPREGAATGRPQEPPIAG